MIGRIAGLEELRTAVGSVPDPEIPPCSIEDLGIVERVELVHDRLEVDLLPTFSGCPALDVIRQDVEAVIRRIAPNLEPVVRFVVSPPWTSDRITPAGRRALEAYGITPPGEGGHAERVMIPIASLTRATAPVRCPFCGSRDTVVESAFGPTLCRSTHYCRSCRNPFEAFKPKIA